MLSARARSREREEGIKATKGELEEALAEGEKERKPLPEGGLLGRNSREGEREIGVWGGFQ